MVAPVAVVPPAPVAPPPPPEIPEAQLAPGTDCKDASNLPRWDVLPTGAALPGTDVVVKFPPGLALDAVASRPHHVVLTSTQSGHPATLVEVWIVPVCRVYNVPWISERLSRASMQPLAVGGVSPTLEAGNLSIGDGLFLAGEGHVGESTTPLWFRWVDLLHSAEFGVAVAASCERSGRTSVCEAGVAGMVDGVRAQVRPKP